MSIHSLEEKCAQLFNRMGVQAFHLLPYATQATSIQREMRIILNQLTPHICCSCENKCCEGFPLEGWFSLEDYILLRVTYGRPSPPPNRIARDTACYFLTSHGCSLPEDMRPFTCVKINCERLTESIKAIGKIDYFNQLRSALEKIHWEVSSLINGNELVSSHHHQQPPLL